MSDMVERVAEAICSADHGGPIDWDEMSGYGQAAYLRMAQAAIDALGLTEERNPDIAGENWGVHVHLRGPTRFIPGPKYAARCRDEAP